MSRDVVISQSVIDLISGKVAEQITVKLDALTEQVKRLADAQTKGRTCRCGHGRDWHVSGLRRCTKYTDNARCDCLVFKTEP